VPRPSSTTSPPRCGVAAGDFDSRESRWRALLVLAVVVAGYFGVRLSRVETSVSSTTPASTPWTPALQELLGAAALLDRR